MRAVVDTNIIVSAAIKPDSTPGTIVQSWLRGQFDALISQDLIAELERLLARPHIIRATGWSGADTADFVAELAGSGELVKPTNRIDAITTDPTDNRVLEAALEGRADYIVSGDRHLLELRTFEGIDIVTTARFAALLSAEDF